MAYYYDVDNDIYCTKAATNYTYANPITFDFPGFFSMNGSAPEDIQILAVAAVFAQNLVNQDADFQNLVVAELDLHDCTYVRCQNPCAKPLSNFPEFHETPQHVTLCLPRVLTLPPRTSFLFRLLLMWCDDFV